MLTIDNELKGQGHHARLVRMVEALKVKHPSAKITYEETLKRFDSWSMRGETKNIDEIAATLKTKRDWGLIIIDSLYKTYPPGVDENSNAGMMRVFDRLNEIAESQNATVIITHHTAKGVEQYKTKGITDLGAGAGAQSRSADCHLVIMPHEQSPDLANVGGVVREFPPFEMFVLRREFPLWVKDDEAEVAIKTTPQYSKVNAENVRTLLDGDISEKTFIEFARKRLNGSKPQVKLVIDELVKAGRIERIIQGGNKPHLLRLSKEVEE